MQPFEVWDSSISVIPLNSETEIFGPLLQFNTNFCTNKLNPALTLAFLPAAIMNSASTAEQQNKKKRTKKQPFSLKFDSEVDFANSFAKGRVCIYPVIFLYFVCLLEFMVGKGGYFEPLRFPLFEKCTRVGVCNFCHK